MEEPIIKCIITRSGQKRYYRFPRQDGKAGVDRISEEEGRRLFRGECEEPEIKDVKYLGDQVLVLCTELISDVSRYARFDSACAQGNKSQSSEEPELHDSANTHKRQT